MASAAVPQRAQSNASDENFPREPWPGREAYAVRPLANYGEAHCFRPRRTFASGQLLDQLFWRSGSLLSDIWVLVLNRSRVYTGSWADAHLWSSLHKPPKSETNKWISVNLSEIYTIESDPRQYEDLSKSTCVELAIDSVFWCQRKRAKSQWNGQSPRSSKRCNVVGGRASADRNGPRD